MQLVQPLCQRTTCNLRTISCTGAKLWNDLPFSLQWHHNGRDGVSSHKPHDCLLNRWFRHRWKKTSKFRVTGLCAGNSPLTDEFPAQIASNAENVSIWWRHHDIEDITGMCAQDFKRMLKSWEGPEYKDPSHHFVKLCFITAKFVLNMCHDICVIVLMCVCVRVCGRACVCERER